MGTSHLGTPYITEEDFSKKNCKVFLNGTSRYCRPLIITLKDLFGKVKFSDGAQNLPNALFGT